MDKARVSRNLLESVKVRKSKVFWTYHEKEVSEFGEADNARNNTRISDKRPIENNMDGQYSSTDWIHIGQDTHVF